MLVTIKAASTLLPSFSLFHAHRHDISQENSKLEDELTDENHWGKIGGEWTEELAWQKAEQERDLEHHRQLGLQMRDLGTMRSNDRWMDK